jgi:hypothetical protein
LAELRVERGQLKYSLRQKYCEPFKEKFQARIVEINQEIRATALRKTKIDNFLEGSRKSKYAGLHAAQGACYKMFGKKARDMSIEEKRQYEREMGRRK